MGTRFAALAAVVLVALTACSAPSTDPIAGGDDELIGLMLAPDEVDGWTLEADDGPVDGDTDDCTGAPYEWPDQATLAHASQFVDRDDMSAAVVLKRVDGAAAEHVEALRGALEPCSPESGPVREHGAMIELVGDDSFAYQSGGSDDMGEFAFANMLVACGDLILEVQWISYAVEADQAALEALVAPVLGRMDAEQRC